MGGSGEEKAGRRESLREEGAEGNGSFREEDMRRNGSFCEEKGVFGEGEMKII